MKKVSIFVYFMQSNLKRIWMWWLFEIATLSLYWSLYLSRNFPINWKTVLNLLLISPIRIVGLKIIYDLIVYLHYDKVLANVDANKVNPDEAFENVPLDDPWAGGEKL